MDNRRSKVDRGKVEAARDSAMLHALFYWKLAEESKPSRVYEQRYHKKAIENADAALRLEMELNGE